MSKKKVVEELAKGIKTVSSLRKNYVARFYCYQKEYHFALDNLDENGKRTYNTDKDGNNRQLSRTAYQFLPLPVFDELSKKIKPDEFESYFEVTEDMLQKTQLLEYLNDKSSARNSTKTKIVTEEEYIKRKNPVAFETSLKHDAEKDILQKRIDELEAQLKNRK